MDFPTLDPLFLSKSCELYSVPPSTILDIKKAFDIIDTNKSGAIQPSEFQSILEESGLMDETGISTKTLISELDSNSNGVIDFEEFLKFSLKKINEKDEIEEIEKVFQYYDEEKKGKIDAKNLIKVAGMLGQKITADEAKKMLNLLDADGDGLVEKEDFVDMMMGNTKIVG